MTSPLPRRTYLYFAAQSINLTAAVMSVTMAAIVGSALAPAENLSTVPYGFQFLCMMLATYPAARLMSRLGRRRSFLLGAVALAAAGVSGYWAVEQQHFTWLVASHSALGVYIAFANFNRFAATDDLAPALKPKALSLVVAGGVAAAVVGPSLTELLRDVGGYALFSLCYASFVGLALLSALLVFWLPKDARVLAVQAQPAKPAAGQRLAVNQAVVIAMAVAAVGYGIMNLLMVQASMHMKHMHTDFTDIRWAIQWHVVAMFAPSFFTGSIIQRLGIRTTLSLGLILLIGCTAINLVSTSHPMLTLSLIVLGLGWNLTYIGGGSLLTQALHDNPAALQMQGKNDLVIAVFATLGAFTPSILLGTLGWQGTNLLCMALGAVLLAATARVLGSRVQRGYLLMGHGK